MRRLLVPLRAIPAALWSGSGRSSSSVWRPLRLPLPALLCRSHHAASSQPSGAQTPQQDQQQQKHTYQQLHTVTHALPPPQEHQQRVSCPAAQAGSFCTHSLAGGCSPCGGQTSSPTCSCSTPQPCVELLNSKLGAAWQQRMLGVAGGGHTTAPSSTVAPVNSFSSHLLLQQPQRRQMTTTTSSSSSPRYVLDYVHTQYPGSLQPLPAPPPPPPAATATNNNNPSTGPRGRVVAVAVSGGVDSAVSAMLLQQQGYQLFGVYMHNWDAADEAGAGSTTCTSEADLADAKALCKTLGIPLYEADFVSRYWNEVFSTFLQGLAAGVTPNPDLACNSHIKFGALLAFARERGADLLATGHYARLGWCHYAPTAVATPAAADDEVAATPPAAAASRAAAAAAPPSQEQQQEQGQWRPLLLTGADTSKDQTYFLAGLTQQQLSHAMFPVGHLSKAQVRELAAAAGLSQVATKRSSAGICFIGRRSFGRFLEAYLQPQPGQYVDADTGAVLGPCANMLAVTVGQKAVGLGGQKSRVYVVGKDMAQGVVHVAAGHDHPALYSSSILLQGPNWVSGQPPTAVLGQHTYGSSVGGEAVDGGVDVQFQARYRQAAAPCRVQVLSPQQAAGFKTSRFCHRPVVGTTTDGGAGGFVHTAGSSPPPPAAAAPAVGASAGSQQQQQEDGSSVGQFLEARLAMPLRGIAPGQMFVMYDGEVCLGSATIVAYGPTRHEAQPQ